MQTLPTNTDNFTTISIIPVANGWIVKKTKPQNDMEQYVKLVKQMIGGGLQQLDSDDIEKMVKESLNMTDAETVDVDYKIDKNTHIFLAFSHVLEFLKETVIE